MTGHGAKFGRKKEEAIAALLSQRNIEEADRVADIGAKTLHRCLQETHRGNENVPFMIMRIEQRIAKLEASIANQSRANKRALPDWLQLVFELDGYVFDAAGQIVRSSDAFNDNTQVPPFEVNV